MKIFTGQQIKELNKYTTGNESVSSIDLMECAAQAISNAFCELWDAHTPVIAFAGYGNNGGDTLAVARLLTEKGYHVETYLLNIKDSLSEGCAINKQRLEATDGTILHEIKTQFIPPTLTENHVVIDGLFGIGLSRPLSGGFANVVKYINASPATIVAVDIPSGLMSEDNSYNIRNNIIHADYTFTLQMPKLSFFFAENEEFIGKWEVLDIHLSKRALNDTETPYELIEAKDIKNLLKPRAKFSHKGNFGHALLIAGSYGMAGASILSAKASLKSGVGLLTIHTPLCNNTILQSTVPEAIVDADSDDLFFSNYTETDSYQAMGIGPGLSINEKTQHAVCSQLRDCPIPVVIDADAISILADNICLCSKLPSKTILTPHPKEMDRLVGHSSNSFDRLKRAINFAQSSNVYIILKGAYSAIISPKGNCYFNTTGNPGMATAGSGDALTGVILALLAQGYSTKDAAITATYAHGLAGDLASFEFGQIGMTALDIVQKLPLAWKKLSE